MDSMINHYTANRKVRNDDAYSPGGEIGRRPDRATLAYCQRAREAYPRRAGRSPAASRPASAAWPITTIGATGSAAPIILDAKADLVVYGMGERPLLEIVAPAGGGRDDSGDSRRSRNGLSPRRRGGGRGNREFNAASREQTLSSCPAMKKSPADKRAFAAMTRIDPRRDQPRQRPAAGAVSWPRGGGGQSAGLAA